MAKTSERESLIITWFLWHFYEMPKFLFSVWRNFIVFGLNFFSIPLLLKTLFSSWRRYKWVYPKLFDVKEFLNTLVSNAFSRIMGAFCRVILILLGIIFQIIILLAGFLAVVLWFLIPFIIITGIVLFLIL